MDVHAPAPRKRLDHVIKEVVWSADLFLERGVPWQPVYLHLHDRFESPP